MFLGIGGVFFIIGTIGSIARAVPASNKKKLLANGERINARILKVKRLDNITVNGVVPYVIFCDSSSVPERKGKPFKSKYIYRELSDSLVGTYAAVYTDAKNPAKYYVDTDKV